MLRPIVLFCTLLALTSSLRGEELFQSVTVHRIFSDQEQYIPEDRLYVYIDNDSEKEFNNIRSLPRNYYTTLDNLTSHESDKTYWVKFSLKNTTARTMNLILFTGNNAEQTIYLIRGNQVEKMRTGYMVPANERDIALGIDSKVRIDLESDESIVVYVKLRSLDNFDPRFDFRLQSYAEWSHDTQAKNTFEGIFSGILLVLSLLGLIFFGYTRKSEFVFYGLYTLTNCIYFLHYYGFLDAYFFPSDPEILSPLWILPNLTAVFYFAFARAFVDTKENFPTWHKVFFWMMVVMTVYFVGGASYTILWRDSYTSILIHNILNITAATVTLVFIISISTKPNLTARYFSVATVFLLISVLFASVQYLSAMDTAIPFMAQVGILVEVLVFSLGIGHKIRREFDNHNITQESLILQLTENEKLQVSKNRELQEKVAERTHQINVQNVQLEKARNEAEQATQAKTEFLSVMSHEIRTPLNAIISLSHLMEIENENQETQEYIDALKFSAESLHSLINDILDYNKIEAGKLSLETVDFSLIDLLKNICESFRFKASSKEVKLELRIGELTPDRVMGDPTRLTQIFNNLISNALKFTHRGEVVIEASLKGIKNEESCLAFKVSDTGIGIPEEKLKEIFEDYEQASRETTRKYGGTGLGLAITKKLIELHGSEIEVESEEGKGTSFYFEIDFKLHASMQIFEDQEAGENEKNLEGASILVVDDNDMNRLVLKRLLSMWNASHFEARSGAEALILASNHKFDLILMDIEMDGMDGFETAEAIRTESKENTDSRIVAMSARRIGDFGARASGAAMEDIINKPFEPLDLFQRLKFYLARENHEKD